MNYIRTLKQSRLHYTDEWNGIVLADFQMSFFVFGNKRLLLGEKNCPQKMGGRDEINERKGEFS